MTADDDVAQRPTTLTSPLHRWLRAKTGRAGWTWRSVVAALAVLAVAVSVAAALLFDRREWFVATFVAGMLVWGFLKKDRSPPGDPV